MHLILDGCSGRSTIWQAGNEKFILQCPILCSSKIFVYGTFVIYYENILACFTQFLSRGSHHDAVIYLSIYEKKGEMHTPVLIPLPSHCFMTDLSRAVAYIIVSM